MSFILDALRKSERERQTGQAPGLPQLMTESPRPPARGWQAAMAVLLTINLAVAAYWLLIRQERPDHAPAAPISPPAPQAATASASAADQPAATAIVNPVMPPQVGAQPPMSAAMTGSPAPAPTPIPQAAPVTPPSTAAPEATPNTPPAPASPSVPRPPSAAPRHPPAAESPQGGMPRERPLPASRPKSEPVPPIAVEDEVAADRDLDTASERRAPPLDSGSAAVTVRPWPGIRPGTPDLRDLPLDFQERIPPLKISMFAYSREPAERFVIIDMKKYRTGDRLPGNVLLLEIQAENLLLELDGQKFRVPRF